MCSFVEYHLDHAITMNRVLNEMKLISNRLTKSNSFIVATFEHLRSAVDWNTCIWHTNTTHANVMLLFSPLDFDLSSKWCRYRKIEPSRSCWWPITLHLLFSYTKTCTRSMWLHTIAGSVYFSIILFSVIIGTSEG